MTRIVQGVDVQQQPAPADLEPGGAGQSQVQLTVSRNFFEQPPRLVFTYTAGGAPRRAETFLPVTACRFQTPVECAKENYFAVWNKISGAPNEVTQVFRARRAMSKADVESAVAGLRYSVLAGVDPSPENVVGAARASVAGKDVYCVVRVELQPAQQAVKLTVKTSNAALSEARAPTACAPGSVRCRGQRAPWEDSARRRARWRGAAVCRARARAARAIALTVRSRAGGAIRSRGAVCLRP